MPLSIDFSLDVYFSEGNDFHAHYQLITSLDNSFQPKSGGDCREYSYEAIIWALGHQSKRHRVPLTHTLYPTSHIIVLTDAPPKGDIMTRKSLRETIITKAKQLEINIHFFLPRETFNCLKDYPDGVEEFTDMANATNGIVIDSGYKFLDFMSSYMQRDSKSLPVVRQKRDVTVEQKCYTFLVSDLSRHILLNFAAKTRQKTITVTKPDNSTEEISLTHLHGSDKLASVLEPKPQAGEWRVCVEEGSLKILDETTRISVDFTVLYYAQSNEQHAYLTPLQPPGCKLGCLYLLCSTPYFIIISCRYNS